MIRLMYGVHVSPSVAAGSRPWAAAEAGPLPPELIARVDQSVASKAE